MPRPIVVFDIDGTVADARHRLHLIAGPADHDHWVRFFEAAVDDPPLAEGVARAKQLAETHDIVWLTARPEPVRGMTEDWLAQHGLPTGRLLMLPEGEKKLARMFKLDAIRRLAEEHEIAVVFDDDPRVIALLEEAGIPVVRADWS
jgi:uncharacterized HAD superfamily protein